MTTLDPPLVGRSGRKRRVIRVMVIAALAVIAVCGIGAGVSWWQLQDLRDLDRLRQTDGQVTGEEYRRRLPDLVEVRYPVAGRQVIAEIPGDVGLDEGDSVEVAYVPGDPERVRLVDGWEPAYTTWLEHGAIGLAALAFVGIREAIGTGARWRGRTSSHSDGTPEWSGR